jgi:hypothetical protein
MDLAPSNELRKEDKAGNHIVMQSTARIIFPVAKTSTIHGRYLPIFIKTVSIIITPSIFFVLGIALEDDGSFSGMQYVSIIQQVI